MLNYIYRTQTTHKYDGNNFNTLNLKPTEVVYDILSNFEKCLKSS